MKIIAHRGLLRGPDKELENSPEQIRLALASGYDVEIDVWYRYLANEWWLGHDSPQYKVNLHYLVNDRFWIHAKNLDALYTMTNESYFRSLNINYFWHDNDDFTLTSENFIWTYSGKALTSNSICVLPEKCMKLYEVSSLNCAGICTDYPLTIDALCNEVPLNNK